MPPPSATNDDVFQGSEPPSPVAAAAINVDVNDAPDAPRPTFVSPPPTSTTAGRSPSPLHLDNAILQPSAAADAAPVASLENMLGDEWDSVTLKQLYGNSEVYTHMRQIMLKQNITSDKIKGSSFYQKLANDTNKSYMACMLCKEQGKPLDECIQKCASGNTSNGSSHLRQVHGEVMAALAKAKTESTKRKMKGNKDGKEGNAKKAKTQSGLHNFVTNGTSNHSIKKKKADYLRNVAAEAYQRMHEFVNNGGHADTVVQDPDFRAMVDYLIEHGQDLKEGKFKPMGYQKYVNIEKDKFDELINQVTSLVT